MVLVSVVIPARNAAHTLGACLDALEEEGIPGPGGELLVIDDGSTDTTVSVASRPDVQVLKGEGRGPAAARNLGGRRATGEILVFLDADTVPQSGWLAEMVAPFEDPAVVGVKGCYQTFQQSPIARFVQLEFEEKYERLLRRGPHVDFIDTGTAAFRRDMLQAVGGFDEGFRVPSAEDVELGFRLAERGARLAFNPKAVVWHRHPESLRVYLRKKLLYGYFRVRVYRRHPGKTLGDSYTPPLMAAQIGLAGLAGLLILLSLVGLPWVVPALAAVLVGFALTTGSLVRRAVRREPDLAPLVPALVFARAFAQGLGIFAGLLAQLTGRPRL